MDHLKFTQDKLSVDNITELVVSADCGAVSVFAGTTRDNFDGKVVTNLEYEAYESMGIKAMQTLCVEIRKLWPEVKNIAIYHRLGIVPVKEASIIIAISSPHRLDAIKAVEWCIDNVKKSVPIFKKEIYGDSHSGTSEWKENSEYKKPNKIPKIKYSFEQPVFVPNIAKHLIQVKADSVEINARIEKFMERKREEINEANIRDFCSRDINNTIEDSCARVDSKLLKRKDSKGHLEVDRVYNTYSRDQNNFDFLFKFTPKDGIEERLNNIESQLSMKTPVSKNIYTRLKQLENKLLHLESLSPEYIQYWKNGDVSTNKPFKRKTIFSVHDVDRFITELEFRKSNK